MYGLFEEKCAGGCCQTKNCLRPIGQVAQLGIVPQRLPAITWREERQSDPGYAVLDINPLTGEQRYPYLRFDDRGVPFSSNPGVWQPDQLDPGIRVRFEQPVKTVNSIAATEILYWSGVLNSTKSNAVNDDFLRVSV